MTPWMLQFAQSILLALALIANLCLFLSLKREFRKQSLEQRAALEMLNRHLAASLERTATRPPVITRSPLDPTCRVQMIERFREGQPASQVAEEFGMPQAEVELLLRIQQLAASGLTRDSGLTQA